MIKGVPLVCATRVRGYIPVVNPRAPLEAEKAFRPYSKIVCRNQDIDLRHSTLAGSPDTADDFPRRLEHSSGSCTRKR